MNLIWIQISERERERNILQSVQTKFVQIAQELLLEAYVVLFIFTHTQSEEVLFELLELVEHFFLVKKSVSILFDKRRNLDKNVFRYENLSSRIRSTFFVVEVQAFDYTTPSFINLMLMERGSFKSKTFLHTLKHLHCAHHLKIGQSTHQNTCRTHCKH